MVEWAHGETALMVVAKKNATACGKDPIVTLLAEKNWAWTHLLMDGADKKIFGHLPKNMSDDHALGTEKHSEDVEAVSQTMMLLQKAAQKKIDAKNRHKQAEDESPGLSFAQMTKAETMKKGLCLK